MNENTMSDTDLCAYADCRLPPADASRVSEEVARDPALAARIADWRAQDAALRSAFAPVLDEPVPARLLRAAASDTPRARPRARLPLRWAAAVAWVSVGLVVGYGLRGESPGPATEVREVASFAHAAAVAHAVYVPEVRHPVEVGADQQAHLVAWLSKRLGAPVQAPQLEAEGFALMGGRLLPGDTGPGAQFMYQDASGQRLTLYLSRSADTKSTAFRFADEGGIGVFYWVDGGTGYALSGTLDQQHLLTIATAVYHQLNP